MVAGPSSLSIVRVVSLVGGCVALAPQRGGLYILILTVQYMISVQQLPVSNY